MVSCSRPCAPAPCRAVLSRQASARLAQFRRLGPAFVALADEHGAVLEALDEAQYELRELEQFQALAAVTG